MKFSHYLLKQYFKQLPERSKVVELLETYSVEVEEVFNYEPKFSGVITAKVSDVKKHPNADRLNVVTVDTGNGLISPVVCGATNVKVGQVVALALPGAYIPASLKGEGGFTLSKTSIRGVESQGMLCSKLELGIGGDQEDGIWELPRSTKLGTRLEYLIIRDSIYELSLPANRPDLYSHLGLAREIASLMGKLHLVADTVNKIKPEIKAGALGVKGISQFKTLELENLSVNETPVEILVTLQRLGIRSVNLVVDITNLVMFEIGQPLHAFDANKIIGDIKVVETKTQSELKALDHKDYVLPKGVLVLRDSKETLDLAGVIGGLNTEVQNSTTKIILTGGSFESKAIRMNSQKVSIRTQAAMYFEKIVAPELLDIAISKVVDLLTKYAGAKTGKLKYYRSRIRNSKRPIYVELKYINSLLGTSFKTSDIKKILEKMGIGVKVAGKRFVIDPPWWRKDLEIESDIVDEVARLQNLNRLTPDVLPAIFHQTEGLKKFRKIHKLKLMLASLGLNETRSYGFISKLSIEKFGGKLDEHVRISNPLSQEQEFLARDQRLPLLLNIEKNLNLTQKYQAFEVSKAYRGYLDEEEFLTIYLWKPNQDLEKTIAEAKGILETVFLKTGIPAYPVSESSSAIYYQDARINLAELSVLDSKVVKKFDLQKSPVFVVISLNLFIKLVNVPLFREQPKFPSIDRDISLIVDQRITFEAIKHSITTKAELLESCEVVDSAYLANGRAKEYHDKLALEGKKNFVIRLVFRAPDRTLDENFVSRNLEQILLQLKEVCKAEIR